MNTLNVLALVLSIIASIVGIVEHLRVSHVKNRLTLIENNLTQIENKLTQVTTKGANSPVYIVDGDKASQTIITGSTVTINQGDNIILNPPKDPHINTVSF